MSGSSSVPLAPAAVTVTLAIGPRRIFRLTRALGETELVLARPAPCETDCTITASFTEPDGPGPLHLCARTALLGESDEQEGHSGCKRLVFLDPSPAARARLSRYVRTRLGLLLPSDKEPTPGTFAQELTRP